MFNSQVLLKINVCGKIRQKMSLMEHLIIFNYDDVFIIPEATRRLILTTVTIHQGQLFDRLVSSSSCRQRLGLDLVMAPSTDLKRLA